MIYKVEFYQLTRYGNEFCIQNYYADTQERVDEIIEQGKKIHKKWLRANDKLLVYIKSEQGEILDKYTFEKQEIKD